MGKRLFSKYHLIQLTDILVALFLITLVAVQSSISDTGIRIGIIIIGVYIIIKAAFMLISHYKLYKRFATIRSIIADYKKGRFTVPEGVPSTDDELGSIYTELVTMGRHLDDLVSSQSNEIMNLRELYNNIVLSITSYFVVINGKDEIIFANESFCKKFYFQLEDIIGKRLEDIFYFITGRIQDAVKKIKISGEPTFIEKTHLLSRNRISIIGDIKLSSMLVRGENQIILVIDDITNRCRKDYQISLISQISETIQKDDEIDKILHTILAGVTSGSGLGFNRAMLFLLSEKGDMLVGKMAVGPDNFDEAIEVWKSLQSDAKRPPGDTGYAVEDRKGRGFLQRVLSKSYRMDSDTVFTRSFRTVENIHVYDAEHDERVDSAVRDFMDVSEFVVVPLVAVNKTIGVIVADNKFNRIPIGEDSIELLSIFAFQAALSIEGYNNTLNLKKEMQKVKDRQDALIESEKLAAVGRIASHIAHEIRNPLVTMGGYAKRIKQLISSSAKNSDGVVRSADVILKESERLEKTLSNVMDFTRESPFILEFNNINEIIEDTYYLLKNLFQERRIQVNLSLSKNVPLVKSDYNQTKQVMLNLLQNAIDATEPNGVVEVITSMNEKYLVIDVRNSDSTIYEEDLNRIFEPFFTTKVTGVGLGLTIVKKIVTDHGGEISVRNLDAGGVEFRVLLPFPG